MQNETQEDVGIEKVTRSQPSGGAILRRKSILPAKPPEAIYNLGFLWDALGESIASLFEEDASDKLSFDSWKSFIPDEDDIDKLSQENAVFFKADHSQAQDSSAISTGEESFAIIVGPKIISRVTTQKLDSLPMDEIEPDDNSDEAQLSKPEVNPTALDLLLCATTADNIIEKMSTLQQSILSSSSGSHADQHTVSAIKRTQNTLSFADLDLNQEKFVCIQVFLSSEDPSIQEENNQESDPQEASPVTGQAAPLSGHDISFWLPLSLIEKMHDAAKMQNLIFNCDTDDPWFKNMLKSMLATPIKINARLSEIKLTIAECSKLSVDQILSIEDDRLDSVSLTTSINQGEYEISTGALCIWGTNKSIQLSKDPSADFIMDMSNLVYTNGVK